MRRWILLLAASLVSSVTVAPVVSADMAVGPLDPSKEIPVPDGPGIPDEEFLFWLISLVEEIGLIPADMGQERTCQKVAYGGLPACPEDML